MAHLYQVRTLPGGKTYGLYNADLQKYVGSDGKPTASAYGAHSFPSPVEAHKYRDRRGFDYSKVHKNFVADQARQSEYWANLDYEMAETEQGLKRPAYVDSDDTYLDALRKQEKNLSGLYHYDSMYHEGKFTGVTKDSVNLADYLDGDPYLHGDKVHDF